VANNNAVIVRAGDTPGQIEANAKDSFTTSITSPLVFNNPNSTACINAFKQFVCATAFTLCNATVACQPDCKAVLSACGVQTSHTGLFDCTQGSANVCLRSLEAETVSGAVKLVSLLASVLLVLIL